MISLRAVVLWLGVVGALCGFSPAVAGEQVKGSPYLGGQLLVATPNLIDPNFSKSVVLMVEHDSGGAFGLIVNRLYGSGPLKDLIIGLGFDAKTAEGDVSVRFGGPVERGQVFIVHGSDYEISDTIKISPGVSVTNHSQIIEDLAAGAGPQDRMVVLGYAGWSAGQLDSEFARGDWISMSVDKDIVFLRDIDAIWERARARAGVPL